MNQLASSSVTLFYNTGFDPVNIPDSQALLDGMTSKTIDAVWVLQDLDIGTIKLKATWSDVEGVDYCKLNDKYYFVQGVRMENVNTATIALQLDALTTVGINNLTVSSGWCTRRHVNNDAMFVNTIEEPFTPQATLVTDFEGISSPTGAAVTLLGTTVSLDDAPEIAKTFKDAQSDESVTIPLVTPITKGTVVQMDLPNGDSFSQTLPNVSLYHLDRAGLQETYAEHLQTLRSLGIESAVSSCYVLYPLVGIELTYNTDNTAIKTLRTKTKDQVMTKLPFKWDTTGNTRNNKVFAGQFNRYTLYSICSGDSQDFLASQIVDPQAKDAPVFRVWMDGSPQGRSYCRPEYFEGNNGLSEYGYDMFMASVQGSPWLNTPLLLSGASGSAIRQYDTQYRNEKIQQNMLVGALKTIGSVAGLVALTAATGGTGTVAAIGGAAAVAGSATSLTQQYNEIQKNNFDTEVSTNLQAPDVRFPRTDSLQAFVGNTFYVVRQRLDDGDTLRFDYFLTMNGYSVSEPLSTECFSGRQYFNYVKASDVVLGVPLDIPLRIKVACENQLMAGVRIWHVKPAYYWENPIV